MVSRPRVSVTALQTYESCPRQYYYTSIVRLPHPYQRALDEGTNIHKLIEDGLRGRGLPAEDAVDDWARQYLVNFRDSRFMAHPPIQIEKSFALELPAGTVRGRIDTIYDRADAATGRRWWEIVDFKSGRSESRAAVESRLQLAVYALAVNRLFGQDDIDYTYFYLRDAAIHTFSAQPALFESVEQRVDRIFGGIAAENWEPAAGCRCWVCRMPLREVRSYESWWWRRGPGKAKREQSETA
jgi:RecB family exonuclease